MELKQFLYDNAIHGIRFWNGGEIASIPKQRSNAIMTLKVWKIRLSGSFLVYDIEKNLELCDIPKNDSP